MGEDKPVSEADAGYGIGAVSRRLGVPAPTLRTWNLRYGLGPSRRSAGGHRRYDAADLRRLAEMQRLIATGLPAAEAARLALALPAADPEPGPAVPPPPERPGARPATAALARAALMLDSHAVSALVEQALDEHGVVWTWERLVLPVLDTICRRQDAAGAGIDAEHLLSDLIQAALHRLARDVPVVAAARPVLLACAEDEQHSLPVHALAAALAERDVQTRVLGARTPYTALAHAMRRLGPAAVFIWSQQAATGDTAPLATLPRLRPACEIVIGGLGWHGEPPPGVIRVSTLPDAVARITSTLG
ncbi:MerR family transcriptional regulator [Nonomuraea gerenzanensis]|uniref:Putative transcriptional regulator n=1 Tax=Nonomuraea gerenzanensis TaxID=93944 RepID=A0A1M4EBQ0_9ACTN|nr:MerR family transcriptional regulator [Nonomuraea gerenzanensis]UBU18486.1 MerR family transcriptional regulator [Nonomuraea gerenzanensis]SBO96325.1 putative transcriptional regulator [Nonomuraea gerenzanensis]